VAKPFGLTAELLWDNCAEWRRVSVRLTANLHCSVKRRLRTSNDRICRYSHKDSGAINAHLRPRWDTAQQFGGIGMKISTASVRKWHGKLAIVLGVFFMFQALTGIIAQNAYMLNRLISPELFKVAQVTGDRIKPGDLVDLVDGLEPDFTIGHVMMPVEADRESAIVIMGGRDKTKRDMSYLMTVDPYADKILWERQSVGGWVEWALYLHIGYFFGTTGKVITVLLGMSLVVFSGLGILLWWRTRHIGSKAKGVVRIHRFAGITAAVFIMIVAITGVSLKLVTWSESASGKTVSQSNMMAAMHQDHDAQDMARPKYDANAAFDMAYEKVTAEKSGNWQLASFTPAGPHAEDHLFSFIDYSYMRTDVLVDPDDGALRMFSTGLTEGGKGVRAVLFPIHTGNIIGRLGHTIFSILGLAVSVWILSGFTLWWRRRRR
jgi:uncharacterized iron-regulated membrane protein